MRWWRVLTLKKHTEGDQMSVGQQGYTIDEKTRALVKARFDRVLARAEAGPTEVLLAPLSREPSCPQAVKLDVLLLAWYQTERRFLWLEREISTSAEVVAATIYTLTMRDPLDELPPVYAGEWDGQIYKVRLKKTAEELYLPVSANLGCFWMKDPNNPDEKRFFLYIANVQLRSVFRDPDFPPERPTTLYQEFQRAYAAITGIESSDDDDFKSQLFGYRYTDHSPKRFSSLANRSVNRRRKIDLRTRARILSRDKSTCQACGRKAPEVRVDVDHRVPVARGGRDDDSNLWTLCEDCNKGKADQLLFAK
jgi:hypothetical protein